MKYIQANDLILAQDEYYSMDSYQTKLNNNVVVVGTSGSGKSRSIVGPNILQASGSYIISDPKGALHKQYGRYLKEKGYIVKCLDLIHPEKSSGYNFFRYIKTEQDVIKAAHNLVYSMGDGSFGNDPFWDQSAELLLTSLIAYLKFYRPKEDQNLASIMKLAMACQVNENDSEERTALDRIMEEVKKRDPDSFAHKQYQKFRIAAGRTLKSILITLTAKLGKFDFRELNECLARDEMELELLGRRKTALFVIVSDTDRSMDDIANIFYSQAMDVLCRKADERSEGRLPVPVRFIMDDFASSCKIDQFPRIIATIRSRNISTMIMIQTESQLKSCYKEDGKTIIGNCDTYVYLGGNDIDTAEAVAKRCNLPMHRILNMPVETNWIFRRGQKPINGRNFPLESYRLLLEPERDHRGEEGNGLFAG